MRKFILASLLTITLLWILVAGPFCWILRDGFGPNSQASEGQESIVRFLGTFSWGPILGILMLATLLACWKPGAVSRAGATNDG